MNIVVSTVIFESVITKTGLSANDLHRIVSGISYICGGSVSLQPRSVCGKAVKVFI